MRFEAYRKGIIFLKSEGHRLPAIVPLLLLVFILGALIIATARCYSGTLPAAVEVDYTSITGELYPLSGVQGSPILKFPMILRRSTFTESST